MAFKVQIKRWHSVANWTWDAGDDVCGICRMHFDGCGCHAPLLPRALLIAGLRACIRTQAVCKHDEACLEIYIINGAGATRFCTSAPKGLIAPPAALLADLWHTHNVWPMSGYYAVPCKATWGHFSGERAMKLFSQIF